MNKTEGCKRCKRDVYYGSAWAGDILLWALTFVLPAHCLLATSGLCQIHYPSTPSLYLQQCVKGELFETENAPLSPIKSSEVAHRLFNDIAFKIENVFISFHILNSIKCLHYKNLISLFLTVLRVPCYCEVIANKSILCKYFLNHFIASKQRNIN